MMMTDRVLLVCALCVLWFGAGGGFSEDLGTLTSVSGVADPIIAPDPKRGNEFSQGGEDESSKHLEDVENHGSATLPEKRTCDNDSTGSPTCTKGPEDAPVSHLDRGGQEKHHAVENRGSPGPPEKGPTPKHQELQERPQDGGASPQDAAKVRELKSTVQTDHLSLNSPSKETHVTVSATEISRGSDGTVQGDNTQNTLNGNDGNISRAAQPDSASVNPLTSVDKDTLNGGAPQLNTSVHTDSEGSTTTALNPADRKNENSGGGDSGLAASPAVGTNSATTTTTATQDASKFNTDGVKLFTEDVEQNASETNLNAGSGTTETAEANSEWSTTAKNTTNKTSNSENTADSDGSTAASHTTSPLLLVVACAYVAAVVAA
ncbi:mucin-associated surface protein (MASP), putative [Trypanosoma cruzi marinkellei]|uniref:Mucin-associated surface protein (MASP), putative n=1 Tax=Trypanosoma cruzi marinkellei TaxID=85056 RepID=K2MJV2_TRYCR|nr:mucin-associated surface protein (MASP), putative [Trypanosoma cruzi marinkellei]